MKKIDIFFPYKKKVYLIGKTPIDRIWRRLPGLSVSSRTEEVRKQIDQHFRSNFTYIEGTTYSEFGE